MSLIAVALDAKGRPLKHWSGRTAAAKVLRRWVNDLPSPYHLSDEDAYELAGGMLEAYLAALREGQP